MSNKRITPQHNPPIPKRDLGASPSQEPNQGNPPGPKSLSVPIECKMCNKTHTIKAPEEGYKKWKGGMLIQIAMPQMSPADRELLISGTCDPCFRKLWKGVLD